MKKLLLKTTILISIIYFGGCASGYRRINPEAVYFATHDLQDGISLSYKYDVLREKGNRKYAKKEFKRGLKLVAVKVTNNTDTTIHIGQDVAFFSGQNQLMLLDPLVIKSSIKQIVPGYLPYLLFTFLRFNVYTETSYSSYPIGLALGPGLTFGNMAVSGTANKNLLDELIRYSLFNKAVTKGETVYGIIGLRSNEYLPLSIKFVNENSVSNK
jgi:hypothetical protein